MSLFCVCPLPLANLLASIFLLLGLLFFLELASGGTDMLLPGGRIDVAAGANAEVVHIEGAA
jgi:hypothetical protein